MFFIGILIPYTDDRLLNKGSKTASSPLTIALTDAGILPAAHLINGLIVVSVIFAGNSSLYVASRTILAMARSGKAPWFLGVTNRFGGSGGRGRRSCLRIFLRPFLFWMSRPARGGFSQL